MSWFSRLRNAVRSERLNREIDDELRYHIEARTDDLIGRGMAPEEAARQAQRRFGNNLLLRESSRDAKLLTWLESLLQDTRFGLRVLRKHAAVTIAAVLSLSLAIGACTAAFTLIDALILRPLPVADPGSLVALSSPGSGSGNPNEFFSYRLYGNFRRAGREQLDLFGLQYGGPLTAVVFADAGGQEENVRAEWLSGDAFTILGIRPAYGRLLTPSDDQPSGGNSVAVLSENFWKRRFGGSPGVLGQWLTVNGGKFQIAGVAQRGFTGVEPGYMADVFFSVTAQADARAMQDPYARLMRIWGRLKPGVTMERARQSLQAALTNFLREQARPLALDPRAARMADFLSRTVQVSSAERGTFTMLRWQFRRPFCIVGMIAVLLLLIACSNLANLFLARGAAREHEMAMRLSIGAGRSRLVRQLLIESGIVAAAACVIGLGFASAAAPSIVTLLAPAEYPAYLDLHTNARVLAFLALSGLAASIGFGLFPALRASAVSPNAALKAGAETHSGRIGMLRPLLGAQVGFSFAVLFVSGLLLLSFHKLMTVDLGFSKDNVVLLKLDSKAKRKPEAAHAAMLEVLDGVRQVRGVEEAALSSTALMGGVFGWVIIPRIRLEGGAVETTRPRYMEISPGFLQTMRIRLLAGRDLTPRDTAASSVAVLVNQAFASRFFAGQNPLGKRFERLADNPKPFPQEIVGVTGDVKYNNVREAMEPTIYAPLREAAGAFLDVRAASRPLALVPALRQEIERADPELRVLSATLQTTRIDNTLLGERLLALIAAFFALVAIVLAAVGLYGVLSYVVVRRTKEIGIRIALGSRRSAILRLMARDVAAALIVGIGAGLAGGIVLARLVTAMLFAIKPSGLTAIVVPLLCLLATAALAALAPAVRAARVDPSVALRYE